MPGTAGGIPEFSPIHGKSESLVLALTAEKICEEEIRTVHFHRKWRPRQASSLQRGGPCAKIILDIDACRSSSHPLCCLPDIFWENNFLLLNVSEILTGTLCGNLCHASARQGGGAAAVRENGIFATVRNNNNNNPCLAKKQDGWMATYKGHKCLRAFFSLPVRNIIVLLLPT